MEDPKWKAEFAKYSGKKENEKNGVSEARFRDYGFLKYWFRGVEKFAPWVRKIHFVTSGQKPEWLDENNPKINLVNHKDYIPAEFLPTYNSVVIERYLHKIPDLAEHFVYFNDDFYIINNIRICFRTCAVKTYHKFNAVCGNLVDNRFAVIGYNSGCYGCVNFTDKPPYNYSCKQNYDC